MIAGLFLALDQRLDRRELCGARSLRLCTTRAARPLVTASGVDLSPTKKGVHTETLLSLH
jgi:hypothetical protein